MSKKFGTRRKAHQNPNALRDAGGFCGWLDGWRRGGLLGVPAHEGEAGFEDCVGGEDAEAHGGQGGAYEHHQIDEVLHTSPFTLRQVAMDTTSCDKSHISKSRCGAPKLSRAPDCPALGFSH